MIAPVLPENETERHRAKVLAESIVAKLAEEDELQSQIVEMRYFGGYTQQEIAELLGISLKKTRREWYLAKAWLKEMLGPEKM